MGESKGDIKRRRDREAERVRVKNNQQASELDLKRQKDSSQAMFVRNMRARSAGGMFFRNDNSTLG